MKIVSPTAVNKVTPVTRTLILLAIVIISFYSVNTTVCIHGERIQAVWSKWGSVLERAESSLKTNAIHALEQGK